MSMMVNPYRFAAPAPVDDLADLFADGEIGDWWRFDNVNTDQSTVGGEITQATGIVNGVTLDDADPANTPNLQQVSGKHVARFDGSADRLLHNFGSDIAQPGTIIVCMGTTSLASASYVTGSSTTKRWQISNNSSNHIIAFAGATLTSGQDAPLGTKVLAFEFNGASTKCRVNGTQTATGNAGTQATNQVTIGALWDGTGGVGADYYSLLFIDRLLTSTELDRAERLLGSHAGLSW